jgi:hypothetical protein
MKRYELINEPDSRLKRIKALIDMTYIGVKAGDLGGLIEHEKNLAQDSYAWVYGDACVYDDACVYGDARVSEYACVYGGARVYGYACVYGDACVSEYARVSEYACVYGGAWLSGYTCVCGDAQVASDNDIVWFSNVGTENGTLTVFKDEKIGIRLTRGCFSGSVTKFLEASKAKHNELIQRQYRLLIAMAELKLCGETSIVA